VDGFYALEVVDKENSHFGYFLVGFQFLFALPIKVDAIALEKSESPCSAIFSP
jgi:hypothetical protein